MLESKNKEDYKDACDAFLNKTQTTINSIAEVGV